MYMHSYEYRTRLPASPDPISQERGPEKINDTRDKSVVIERVIRTSPLPTPRLMIIAERRGRSVNEEWKQDEMWQGPEDPYEVMSPL